MGLLEATDLSQSYAGLRVLENISFSIEAGEKVALIGPNGAGKTTLLNVLTGIQPLRSGRIKFLGQEITSSPPNKRVSLGLARSFQLNTLFPSLCLLDNVLLAILGTKASRFRMIRPITTYRGYLAEAKDLLRLMNLWERRDEIISSSSYGEQRQMEILLALASRPKLLLLDEPSAGLSTVETKTLVEIIRSLAKDIAILFTAHDMDLVFTLGDRIMVLYYGEILAQGTPKDIRTSSKVREIYLGTVEQDA